jgi:hypothetical protein
MLQKDPHRPALEWLSDLHKAKVRCSLPTRRGEGEDARMTRTPRITPRMTPRTVLPQLILIELILTAR